MSDDATENPARKAEVRFQIELREDQLPLRIEWDATDNPQGGPRNTRAVMLSVWDEAEKKAMVINLWTPEMLVDDMKLYAFQVLMTLADTFEHATSESERAEEIRTFAKELAGRLGFVRNPGASLG